VRLGQCLVDWLVILQNGTVGVGLVLSGVMHEGMMSDWEQVSGEGEAGESWTVFSPLERNQMPHR